MSAPWVARALSEVRSLVATSLFSNLQQKEAELLSKHFNRLFDYSVGGGKNVRAHLVVNTFTALRDNPSPGERTAIEHAAVSVEMLQSFLLLADDIMDESTTRRGKPCWHTLPDIGLTAVNDAILLHITSGETLGEAFRGDACRPHMISAFQRTVKKTLNGQMIDVLSARDIDSFTWDRYEQLVEHKTSQYSFVLPIELGILATDSFSHLDEVARVGNRIGYLFQAQDDFIDVFGDPQLTGKVGTDIVDGKCTWVTCLAVQLLKDKPALLKEIKENFGCVKNERRVKEILAELGIPEIFTKFEDSFSSDIAEDISRFPIEPLRPLLSDVLAQLTRRKK